MFHMSREIYDKIAELGQLVTQSNEYQAMKQAEKTGEADPALSACVAQYMGKRTLLEKETAKDDKDFDAIGELTRELDDISTRMYQLPAYAEMQQARKQFNALMQGIVEVLQNVVEPDVQCSCSGNCESCGGCGQA